MKKALMMLLAVAGLMFAMGPTASADHYYRGGRGSGVGISVNFGGGGFNRGGFNRGFNRGFGTRGGFGYTRGLGYGGRGLGYGGYRGVGVRSVYVPSYGYGGGYGYGGYGGGYCR